MGHPRKQADRQHKQRENRSRRKRKRWSTIRKHDSELRVGAGYIHRGGCQCVPLSTTQLTMIHKLVGFFFFCKSSCLKKIKEKGFPKGIVWEQEPGWQTDWLTDWQSVGRGQRGSSCPAGMAELCSWHPDFLWDRHRWQRWRDMDSVTRQEP